MKKIYPCVDCGRKTDTPYRHKKTCSQYEAPTLGDRVYESVMRTGQVSVKLMNSYLLELESYQ